MGILNENMTKYLMQKDSIDRSLEKALADIRAQNLMKIYADPASIVVL